MNRYYLTAKLKKYYYLTRVHQYYVRSESNPTSSFTITTNKHITISCIQISA